MEIICQTDQQPVRLNRSDYDLEKAGPGDSVASIPTPTLDYDSEKTVHSVSLTSIPNPDTETLDIEHFPVQDDPRKWSPLRKVSYHQQ